MAKTILIVDDSESIRTILKLTLEFKGYAVIEAGDGLEAYRILRQTPCDLVIADIVMPHMSGVELLSKIRHELRKEDLPVIICTAEKNVNEEEFIRKGASKVLVKPFSPQALLEIVESLIQPG
jgi:DNA-binding response OmpR family regulator